MKLITYEDIDFGAYHADGCAAVLATSRQEADDLLVTYWANSLYGEYKNNEAQIRKSIRKANAGEDSGTIAEYEVTMEGPPRVLLAYYGCDC